VIDASGTVARNPQPIETRRAPSWTRT
jgi:hypothetical protein